MKSLALMFLGLAMSASNASAFYVQAQAYVTPTQVSATVCNSSFEHVMTCSVRVAGYTNYGTTLNAWATLTMLGGACEYAYVYANGWNVYFVNGAAQANCYFE
jgi:hypothetical protein